MAHSTRVSDLAEAVADGRTPDWIAAEALTDDPVERAVITKLRALQSIHGLMTASAMRPGDDSGRTPLHPGDRWGALEVRAHVGRGRFGDVYRAWDPALEREVALKLVRHTDREGAAEARVVDEGRLMARVRHPNVLAIHGAQRIDGVSGLWMEFVEGQTLARELASHGPFSAERLAHVGVEVAQALAAVHRAGLVHRDVTAHNVLREESGRIVLGDFGTGLDLEASAEDRCGLAGTPAYLAPEVFDGSAASPRSDVYSLGVLLFHLATAGYPVPGASLRDLRDAHSRAERLSLTARRPDLPPALVAAIERSLAADPARRFTGAQCMADTLAAVTRGQSSPVRAGRRIAIAAALAIALAGLGSSTLRTRWWSSGSTPVAAGAGVASGPSTPSRRAAELFDQAHHVAGAEGGQGVQRPHVVEQLAREALREDPDFVMAHLLLANALYSQPEKAREAVPQVERAVKSAERRTVVDRHLALGELHGMRANAVFGTERRRLQQLAVAEFEAVIGLEVNNDWALGCLANLYPGVGNRDGALRAAERLVSIRPTSLTALWRAAHAAHQAGQIDAARRYAERAIRLDVVIDERNAFQAGSVRALRAHLAWLQRDPAAALADADRASEVIDSLPASARGPFAQRLVWVYMTLGRLQQAKRMAEVMDERERGFLVTRVASATFGHAMDESQRQDLRAALARYYPDVRTATNIIHTWVDAGRVDQAEAALRLLAPRPATPPQYWDAARGEVALARGNPLEAIAHLESAAQDDSSQRGTRPWARNVLALAQAYVATAQRQRAVDLLVDATRDPSEYSIEGAHAWLPLRERLFQLHQEAGDAASADWVERGLRAHLVLADAGHAIKRRLDRVSSGPAVRR